MTLLVHQNCVRTTPASVISVTTALDPKDNQQLPERATYLLASLREANASAAERG